MNHLYRVTSHVVSFCISDENVPSVCVVVEGGLNTIKTVYEAVRNSTPCLIIAGSGRAANILAYAFGEARCVTSKIKKSGETVEKK